jgi:hypothetical protein
MTLTAVCTFFEYRNRLICSATNLISLWHYHTSFSTLYNCECGHVTADHKVVIMFLQIANLLLTTQPATELGLGADAI